MIRRTSACGNCKIRSVCSAATSFGRSRAPRPSPPRRGIASACAAALPTAKPATLATLASESSQTRVEFLDRRGCAHARHRLVRDAAGFAGTDLLIELSADLLLELSNDSRIVVTHLLHLKLHASVHDQS